LFKLGLLIILGLAPYTARGFDFGFGWTAKTEVPEWVANPTKDDAKFIYGIGSGISLAKAEQAALKNISGKLATVVSSSVFANTSVHQGAVSSTFSEEIITKTFDTKLSGFETERSDQQGKVFYVKVRMSRTLFVKDTLERLASIDEKIASKIKLASRDSKLQLYFALISTRPDVSEATTLVYLLQAASPSFDSNSYLIKYREYQSRAEEMPYRLGFRVNATAEMKLISDLLVSMLGEHGLLLLKQADQADATIRINGSADNKRIFGDYMTQLRVTIQVDDKLGRKIKTQEYVVAGSSLNGYENSLRDALQLLRQRWEDEGVLSVVGMRSVN